MAILTEMKTWTSRLGHTNLRSFTDEHDHFWLEQNSKVLGATIQALEVQKMTLATLQGMNFNMGDIANALKLKTSDTMLGGVQKMSEATAEAAGAVSSAAAGTAAKSHAARKTAPPKSNGKQGDGKAAAAAAAAVVDPLQWWGSLTQQFQQIATNAMKDAAAQTAKSTAKNMAGGMAREAMKSATSAARKRTAKRPARAVKKS